MSPLFKSIAVVGILAGGLEIASLVTAPKAYYFDEPSSSSSLVDVRVAQPTPKPPPSSEPKLENVPRCVHHERSEKTSFCVGHTKTNS
jgi:hypothetical protein